MKVSQIVFFYFMASHGVYFRLRLSHKDKLAIGMDWGDIESPIPWTPDFSNLSSSSRTQTKTTIYLFRISRTRSKSVINCNLMFLSALEARDIKLSNCPIRLISPPLTRKSLKERRALNHKVNRQHSTVGLFFENLSWRFLFSKGWRIYSFLVMTSRGELRLLITYQLVWLVCFYLTLSTNQIAAFYSAEAKVGTNVSDWLNN